MNTAYFTDTKPHYRLLDGLRGVAALMVVWYHTFEGFAFAGAVNGAGNGSITTFNHGYLAVDFFFMLSGFVISYAYDDRWNSMSLKEFFKRRLIRLHPMVAIGAIIGAVSFCIGGCTNWAGEHIGWSNLLLALVLGMLLIPACPGARYDVRGNGEMFPLNGPSWSLFFEYIGNILYALFIRKLSTKWLKITTSLIGMAFAWFATSNASGYGSIGVGWTLDSTNFFGGLLRVLFPFSLGMVLQRSRITLKIKDNPLFQKSVFWLCSIALFVIFSVPFLGASESFSTNGIYEIACIALLFPPIIICASQSTARRNRTINLLGTLSYPLYIVHYPIMYLFYSWLIKENCYTLSQTWPVVTGIFAVNILLAFICLKCFDIPVRKRLASKWLTSRG